MAPEGDGSSRRMFGWWYISIGFLFITLGTRGLLAGAGMGAVGLRFLVAMLFIALGIVTLQGTEK